MINANQVVAPLIPRKAAPTVGILQTLPACDSDEFADTAGKEFGFSLQAGVAAGVDERKKLGRWRRYLSRPVDAEKRLLGDIGRVCGNRSDFAAGRRRRNLSFRGGIRKTGC